MLSPNAADELEFASAATLEFPSDKMNASLETRTTTSSMAIQINKVAVLGAGTMGSRIAAHLANAGIPSYLLDIVPPGATLSKPGERNSERDKIVTAESMGFPLAGKNVFTTSHSPSNCASSF